LLFILFIYFPLFFSPFFVLDFVFNLTAVSPPSGSSCLFDISHNFIEGSTPTIHALGSYPVDVFLNNNQFSGEVQASNFPATTQTCKQKNKQKNKERKKRKREKKGKRKRERRGEN